MTRLSEVAADSTDRWQKLWDIFHAALETESGQRNDFLIEACGSDSDLHREVQELLACHDRSTLLDRSPFLIPDSPAKAADASAEEFGPQPGDILANRFEIIRVLGRGGMAKVYEALDMDLGTRVALKILHPKIASDPEAAERFNREINLARRVTHPNACRIFDLFHHEDSLAFLTMELLEGETLYERVRRDGPLTISEALPIIEQVAAALSVVHELGIIHRDLKPTNIMLVSEESGSRAVVTDFGLAVATAESHLTGEGRVLGTPEYMAPEQLQGGNITPATDVYALGLVMYEMLTGKQPFKGESPFASPRLYTPAPSPRKHIPGLNRTWERTILRCLERDPQERFQSPADVVAALKGGPISVRLFTKRRKRQMGIGLAAVVSLLIVFTLFWRQQNREQPVSTNLPFEKRDWLLITAFENKTAEQSLDGALEYALQRELNNSQFVNVVPRERIEDALLLMKKSPATKVADFTIPGSLSNSFTLQDS